MTFDVQLKNYLPSTPLASAKLKACAITDTTCATPLQEVTTDASGNAKFTVPSTGTKGFDGYIDGSGITNQVDTLYFFDHPVIGNLLSTSGPGPWPLVSFSKTIFGAATGGKVTPDAGRGYILDVSFDCKFATASGISIAASSADGMSKTIYSKGSSLDVSLTQTESAGVGFIFNVPLGATKLTNTDVATSKKLGEADIFMRAGTISDIRITPAQFPQQLSRPGQGASRVWLPRCPIRA